MNSAQRNELRAACQSMLTRNNIKPSSVKGGEMIYAFWSGAMNALDEDPPDAYVTILLMAGRYEELVGERHAETQEQ